MTLQENHKGYLCIVLHKNGIANTKLVHRLVATAFIPNENNLPQVNHKDTDKHNNSVQNLEWITNTDNIRHAFENGCFITTDKQLAHARENQGIMANKRKKPVSQYTMEGEKIDTYPSVISAERQTGINNSKIVGVCKGKRKSAGGYIWKYETRKEAKA